VFQKEKLDLKTGYKQLYKLLIWVFKIKPSNRPQIQFKVTIAIRKGK